MPSPSPSQKPPEAWEPLFKFARLARRPLETFLKIEAASGIILIVAAAVALLWVNSPWRTSYTALWHTPIGIQFGDFEFVRPLEWVVNDGLMAIFFFVVGLEIRREIHHGELSTPRRAALPLAAALGGMVVPAIIYLALAGGPPTHAGWGIPMATDIAFAVGILTLLGKRVPPALRVLLLALAVIDDLGAIIVIALFYSKGIALAGFGVAACGIGGIFLLQFIGVRSKLAYVAPAVVAWAGVYAAGVHPTIAGVLIGLITPVRAWLGPERFINNLRVQVTMLGNLPETELASHGLNQQLHEIDVARREAISPAESLIETLHPWVAYAIMPIFALANAGVSLAGLDMSGAGASAALGVGVGLCVGKPIGVITASWLALKLRIGVLPAGLGGRHLLVLGLVAGVGFTMSLFIAQLAFPGSGLLADAKLGILVASAAAAMIALLVGRLMLPAAITPDAATTADEAESSTEK
ncbi:MAG: Na+/H+ antiporter NhaA [Kofleriaceae bacterium]|nr:Na+/H+ antiporter NhaA [Kofleriaceae bacterium]